MQAISKFTKKYLSDNFYPNVTKGQIIKQISKKTGIDKTDVHKSLDLFFQAVKNTMTNGENIYIRGFGTFIVKKRAKKVARNITKNTAVIVDESYVPYFKPAKAFIADVKSYGKSKENGKAKKAS